MACDSDGNILPHVVGELPATSLRGHRSAALTEPAEWQLGATATTVNAGGTLRYDGIFSVLTGLR